MDREKAQSKGRFADEDFLSGLDTDPPKAILQICDRYQRVKQSRAERGDREFPAEMMLDAFWFLQVWVGKFCPDLGISWPDIPHNARLDQYVSRIHDVFDAARTNAEGQLAHRERQRIRSTGRSYYEAVLKIEPVAVFTDEALGRVQELVNTLRAEILSCPAFTPDHRRRLLHRLESLQAELHKEMSNVDRLWALRSAPGSALSRPTRPRTVSTSPAGRC